MGASERRHRPSTTDVEILDFAGPTEVFTAAGHGAFRVYTVAPDRTRPC